MRLSPLLLPLVKGGDIHRRKANKFRFVKLIGELLYLLSLFYPCLLCTVKDTACNLFK